LSLFLNLTQACPTEGGVAVVIVTCCHPNGVGNFVCTQEGMRLWTVVSARAKGTVAAGMPAFVLAMIAYAAFAYR